MPELPEVEVLKKSLSRLISNTKINKIKIKNKNLRYKITHSFQKKLKNNFIYKITRRSKYIIFDLKNKDRLLLHLGMSGTVFLIRSNDQKKIKTSFYYDLNIIPKHNHIYFFLDNGLTLIYNDVRRFGFFKLYKNINLNNIPFIKKLGYEPFSKLFNLKYFRNFIVNKKKNSKNLLMDQTFVSGLGNIYVNEVLFLSKINPLKICSKLKTNEIRSLIQNIKRILKLSILKGGSSIRDFKNSYGKSGNFQQFFHVYGKESMNCSRISCKGKIKKIIISNRSSFYCNKCQK